jgi:hypothetical protein
MVMRLQSRLFSPPLPTGRKAGHPADLPVRRSEIAVKSRNQVVHSKVGKEDGCKTDEG